MSPADTAPPKLWFQGNVAAWFPDSQRVVFSRQGDLWAMRVGSTEATQITKDKEDERAPAVSPDGKWIAFYSVAQRPPGHLARAERRQRAVETADEAAMAEDDPRFAPAWSPDSKQIAYISNKADYWHDDVWVIDVASGQAAAVVEEPDGGVDAGVVARRQVDRAARNGEEGLLVRGSAGHLGHRCRSRAPSAR